MIHQASLSQQSISIRLVRELRANPPPRTDPLADSAIPASQYTPANGNGSDGVALNDAEFSGASVSRANKTGIYALLKLENQLFNLLCIPPLTSTQDVNDFTTLAEALSLASKSVQCCL